MHFALNQMRQILQHLSVFFTKRARQIIDQADAADRLILGIVNRIRSVEADIRCANHHAMLAQQFVLTCIGDDNQSCRLRAAVAKRGFDGACRVFALYNLQ
ncbi:MAG TPA: hypothetical protein VJ577_12770 [Burkholderiaceae bacterium]|nr:hypothetical protein [Burkholderiaceae bacterium]